MIENVYFSNFDLKVRKICFEKKGEKFTSPADITKIQKRILELLEKNDCNHS